MARINNKSEDFNADDILSIIAFKDFFEFENDDRFYSHEIPASSHFQAGIRSDCEYSFYLGSIGSSARAGTADKSSGIKYRKYIEKIRLKNTNLKPAKAVPLRKVLTALKIR
jgi:hypothetical protein